MDGDDMIRINSSITSNLPDHLQNRTQHQQHSGKKRI